MNRNNRFASKSKESSTSLKARPELDERVHGQAVRGD